MSNRFSLSLRRRKSRNSFSSRQIRKLKKRSTAARVASIIRRRRSAFRDRYERALIKLAERYLNVPTRGQEGLIFSVPQIPSGHSREDLIQIFNDVIEDMNNSSSANDASSGSSNFSNRSAHAISPVSGPAVDLLSGNVFGPDDFDRYLGGVCLKPLPASPVEREIQNAEASDITNSKCPVESDILIEVDSEIPTVPSPPPTLPNLSDSRSPSVDELFFGNTIKLRVRSLLASPPSPPLSPIHESRCPTPPVLSDSRPPSMDELFYSKFTTVDSRLYMAGGPRASSPPTVSQDSKESFRDEAWQKPLVFRGSPYPHVIGPKGDTQGQSQQRSDDATKLSSRTVTRRRGGTDLRVEAKFKLTVIVPTPETSPPTPQPYPNTPLRLRPGYSIPRKPVAQSPVKNIEPIGRWRDYSPPTKAASPYLPFSPADDQFFPSLPYLPFMSTTTLMEEMNNELDKLMDDLGVQAEPSQDSQVSSESQWSLLDAPVDETTGSSPLSASEHLLADTPTVVQIVDPEAELFGNVSSMLQGPYLGMPIADDPIRASSGPAALIPLDPGLAATPTLLPSGKAEKVDAHPRDRYRKPNHQTTPSTQQSRDVERPSPAPSATWTPKVPSRSNRAPTIPPRTSSKPVEPTTQRKAVPDTQPPLPPKPTSFSARMNKATLQGLLNASNEVEFQRAFSAAKKTKRESRTNGNREFEWQRWVDQEWEDPSVELSRARREKRRRQEAKQRQKAAAGSVEEGDFSGGGDKEIRRRSNRFEVLDEEEE